MVGSDEVSRLGIALDELDAAIGVARVCKGEDRWM